MSAAWPCGRGLDDHRRAGGRAHRGQGVLVDGAGADVGVPVAGRAELVARVVEVHQVDPPGDGLRPVDDVHEVLAGGERVAGVEAEPDAELADGVPQPGQRVEPAGHRVVPARGVLDEHRHREAALVGLPREELAPVVDALRGVLACGDVAAVHDEPDGADLGRRRGVLHDELARRDADAVVQRGEVDDVRRVHDHGEVAVAQLRGLRVRRRLLPALRIGEEHLHDVGAALGRRRDRVVLAHVGPDEHAVRLVSAPDGAVPHRHRRAVAGGQRGWAGRGLIIGSARKPTVLAGSRTGSVIAALRVTPSPTGVSALVASDFAPRPRPPGRRRRSPGRRTRGRSCRGAVRTSCRGWTAAVPVHRR